MDYIFNVSDIVFDFSLNHVLGYFHQTDEDLLQFFKVSCAKNEEDVEDMHLDWPRYQRASMLCV